FVIIDANHGHLIGYRNTRSSTGREDLPAPDIVAGHDPDRFRESAHPISQIVAATARCWPDRTAVTGFSQMLAKVHLPPFGPVKARVAAVTEMTQSPFQEVFSGKASDGSIVSLDPRQMRQETCRT